MEKFSVLTVAFVLILVIRLVDSQCPTTCQCSLWTINCRNAQLTDVPGGEILSDVMRLDLSYNRITTLYNNSFVAELSSVEILLLANNNIRFIEVNSISKFENLNFLDLSGNDIGFISPEILSRNTNLMSLNLTNNPNLKLPDSGYNLPELVKLEMEKCRIKQIPAQFFKNTTNIIFLYLSMNELSFLDPTNFKHLRRLEELDLSDNWFKVFQRDLSELHSTTKLRISKNPWICDCYFITALEFFERRGDHKPPICKSPNQLRGMVANKTAINELFHCSPTKTTATTTTTTSTVVYYDAFKDDEELYDYDSYGEDYIVEKLAHIVGPVLEDSDVTDSGEHNSLVNPSTVRFAGMKFNSLWLEKNQWWMYCAVIVLLAALIVAIVNKLVNDNKRKYLLTNVHYNDDV